MSRGAYILTCSVIFAGVMLAVGWAVSRVAPDIVRWLDGAVGSFWSGALLLSIIPIGYGIAYWFDWRHPSGSSREP